MTVPKPITLLILTLAIWTLGLIALAFDWPVMTALADFQNSALNGHGLPAPAWAATVELGFLAIAGGGEILFLLRGKIAWAGLLAAGALAGSFYAALMLTQAVGIAPNLLGPVLVLLAIFAAGVAAHLTQIRDLKRALRQAFADSLPPAAIDRIVRDPSLLTLDGSTRTVTVLACGVRSLPELAALFRDNPKSFTRLLEEILTPLMAQILRHGGVIDRLTADGFTAYWNAPLDDPDHAAHACDAARGMMAAMSEANRTLARRYDLPALEIGVGVATGPVIAGGFSGHGRLSYGISGDAVQVAARLQILSRVYGPAVIAAEETLHRAGKDFAFLEIDYVAQNRDDAPLRLYALLDDKTAKTSPKARALATFHEHIFESFKAQRWDQARTLVEQCARLSGACHTLYDLYLARIRYFEANPPGPEWDGAFRPVLK
ncbi:MAG TPA: adenylate/guanylate cyclase domain-containing protein [Rhizomicrobium sp.]